MKPILIIPPAPARWPALDDLLRHKGPPWIDDIKQRITRGVAGAQDAFAVMAGPGPILANVTINKCGDCGVLGHCFTRPEQRGRGYARRLLETALSWFEMTGGKYLFLGTTAELDAGLYSKFGFRPLRRAVWAPFDRLTMYRPGRGALDAPLDGLAGPLEIRELSRADWPALVMLLQYCPGPDPRVPLDESAVTAEIFTLDLLDHQERGACVLKGAFRGGRLIAAGSVATDRHGGRTYAVILPHVDAPAELRKDLVALAAARGFTQVEFPMEALGAMSIAPATPVPTPDALPPQPAPPPAPSLQTPPVSIPEEPPEPPAVA
jgi:GNAT superfamily N-acetyltransferase